MFKSAQCPECCVLAALLRAAFVTVSVAATRALTKARPSLLTERNHVFLHNVVVVYD